MGAEKPIGAEKNGQKIAFDEVKEVCLHRLMSGRPLPHDEAVRYLRRGMKMIRVEFFDQGSLREWRMMHGFVPETSIKLVWDAGSNWPAIVDDLEANPLPWQAEIEARNKEIQEKLQHILLTQGQLALEAWLYENVINPLYGGE